MVWNVIQEAIRSSLGVDLLDLVAEVIEQCCPLVTSCKFKIMKLNPRLAIFATIYHRGAGVNRNL